VTRFARLIGAYLQCKGFRVCPNSGASRPGFEAGFSGQAARVRAVIEMPTLGLSDCFDE